MSRVPQSDQMRASGTGRRKVALPPGRSQLDWVRNSAKFRRPRPRPIDIRELRRHRTREDAWMAINGKVFDVTAYVEYHPGGIDMILAGAGKDATALFNKYHIWVNPDFMLSNCYLGVLTGDDDEDSSSESSAEQEGLGKHEAVGSSSAEESGEVTGGSNRVSRETQANSSARVKTREQDDSSDAPFNEDSDYSTAERLEALRLAELAE